MELSVQQTEAEELACMMLHATLHIAAGKTAQLHSSSGIFALPEAECFEHFAEGEYKGIFDIIPLQPQRYRENGKIISVSQAVVIDYHLKTPEAVKEPPGFFNRFLEGFVEGWNEPPPERRQRRQHRNHF